MRPVRTRFELRMELATDHERMVRHFHDLDQHIIRGSSGDPQTGGLQLFPILVVELEPMTMPLHDLLSPVRLAGQ